MAREVQSLPPLWLQALFKDRQWKTFSEVVRLLDKAGEQNEPLLSKMTEEALHAYVNSQEFQNNPQKLLSLLQKAGCLNSFFSDTLHQNVLLHHTSGSIKDRHSFPKTVMSNNVTQSELNRSLPALST